MPDVVAALLGSSGTPSPSPRVISGYISKLRPAPASFSDPIFLIAPNHSEDRPYGPCAWPAIHGATKPVKGDPVVFVMDDNNTPHVVWWGSGSTAVTFPGSSATSATYYVSTSGSDSNVGSQGSPWQTVAKVNAAALNPGDTVLFNGGQTFSDAVLTPPSAGSELGPITFSSYGTGQATISLGAFVTNDWCALQNLAFSALVQLGSAGSGRAWWAVLDGCTITLPGGANTSFGVLCVVSSHVRITRNIVTGTGDSGILLGVSSGGTSNGADGDDYLVEGNKIVSTGTNGGLAFGKHGIYCKVTRATIRHNVITDFAGSGISLRYSDAIAHNNTIQRGSDNTSTGIAWFQYDTSVYGTTRITDNTITDVNATGIFVSASDVGGNTGESFAITGNRFWMTAGLPTMDLRETTGTYAIGNNLPLASNISNGSFESATLTMWATTGLWSTNTGATVTQDAGSFYAGDGGTHSGKVITTVTLNNEGIEQDLGILPVGTYYAQCRVKGNAGGEALTFVVASSGQSVTRNFTATTDFTHQHTLTFKGDGINHCYLAVMTNGAAVTTFFVDDVRVGS